MMRIVTEAVSAIGGSLALSPAVKVTLVTTLALIGTRMARRSRASVRHLVLTAAFIVLLALPFGASISPSIQVEVPLLQAPLASAIVTPGPDTGAIDNPTAGASHITSAERTSLPVSTVIAAAWTAGTVLFLLPTAAGLWQLRRIRRFGLPWLHGQAILGDLADEIGIKRRVAVLMRDAIPGPMTCGILHSAIVLPPDVQSWSDAALQRAMVHELEHVRRGDCLIHGVARMVCALYWFHPLVWMSWRRLGLEAERACDDAVLRRADATEYADQLVTLAKRITLGARTPILAMANRSDLATRIVAVLDTGQRRGRPGALYVTAALTTAALLIAVISPLRAVSTIPERQAAQASVSQIGREQKLSFEVATIKPSAPDDRSGKFITMQGAHQFVARNYTVKDMVAAAYNLPPRLISGGQSWIDFDRYEILAATPGEVRPNTDQQMSMLRTLLADRFNLTIHREHRELPIYELTVARDGAKLKESTSSEEFLINRMFPDNRVLLPARNVTMVQFASMLQRAVLDRPVLEKTGLSAKYDFDLEWTRDETQFGGQLPVTNVDNPKKPDLFAAIQQQLGLRLQASKGTVEAIVIDRVERPSEN